MSSDRIQIEWAVIEPVFRGERVIKDGLGSRFEAEKWLAALEETAARQDHEHFMRTDGMVHREGMKIAWRVIDRWHSTAEDLPR